MENNLEISGQENLSFPILSDLDDDLLVPSDNSFDDYLDATVADENCGEKQLDNCEDSSAAYDDILWQARTGLNTDTLCGAIETVIFMSDRPVSLSKLKTFIDEEIPLRVIHEAISRLQQEYEVPHHGLRLVEVAEGFQFRTKATYSKYVQDLFKVNALVLSPTALEVLAIIAYKQPVSRNAIDKIRGVDSSHIVRALMDKRLVKVCGRSDELGRPVVYGTTTEFLEVFNLADISQLPPERELEDMVENHVGNISEIRSLVGTGDKARFMFDEIDELDELSKNIKSVSADTLFTKSLKIEDKKRLSDDGVPVKSAFEVLEEHIERDIIGRQNKDSLLSELIMAAVSPTVVNDLTVGPHNAPIPDDDDFQMIDLETGEVVEENQEHNDYLFTRDDEGDIARALDNAFANFSPRSLDDVSLDDTEDTLEEKNQHLDDIAHDIADRAEDFDLDLSFLKDAPEVEENMDQFLQ